MTNQIQSRLKRVKGQIEGIERMFAENRNCEEILQQLQAARSALKEVMLLLVETDICQVLPSQRKEELMERLRLLFKIK